MELSERSLVDAASTGGGAGTGSWCFINRLVANGAKVLVTAVPLYGQVSLYNLPVLDLRTLDGIFSGTEGTSVPDSC